LSNSEELYDVLDEFGKPTGEVLPKNVVHDKGLWHASTHIWIINDDSRILLQYRAADKKVFPSCWDTSVAGHISAGDNAKTTAVREVVEEIGLKIFEEDLVYLGSFSEELPWLPGGKHREHNTVFGIKKNFNLSDLQIQQEELTDLKLISADELEVTLKDAKSRTELSGHKDKLFELAIQFARN